tara:strand:+ start:1102 stop:1428 length:327 start_codon:yes stop_codon:yes gene_type:complete
VTYRPLDERLTIGKSVIHGQGLIAIADIPANENLGVSHVIIDSRIVRTPMGGFVNHQEEPNCRLKVGTLPKNDEDFHMYDYECKYLWTSREIKAGEELTVKYKMYDPT